MLGAVMLPDQDPDEALLTAWQRGDMRAARQLYRRHFGAVCQFFRNKLSDLQEVADLVGETFLELVKTAGRRGEAALGERSTFRAYLLGIARNVLFHHLRARYRRRDLDFDIDSIGVIAPRSVSSIVAEKQELDVLIHALRGLPVADQVLFEAKYFEYFTDPELAHLLQIPASTVPGRLRAAKRRLLAAVGTASSSSTDAPAEALECWIAELRNTILRTNPPPAE